MARRPTKPEDGHPNDDGEDSCPTWVNGIRSILSITFVPPGLQALVNPPTARYLEETMLGLIGGKCDSTVPADIPHRSPGESVAPVHRVQGLSKMMTISALARACHALFFLVLGGVFQHFPEEAMESYRKAVGESWGAAVREGTQELGEDQELRDEVFTALPFMCALAIFRLCVDGFLEDTKVLRQKGEQLLLKASLVTHFELLGFQLTTASVRHTQRRLFLSHVLKRPHTNLHNFMLGQKRQAKLDACKVDTSLAFGKFDVVPLEETQLEHVLHESERRGEQQQRELASGKEPWELEATPVPENLSVSRHLRLNEFGADMERAHTDQIGAVLGLETTAEWDEDEDVLTSEAVGSSQGGSSPRSPGQSQPCSPFMMQHGGMSPSASVMSPCSSQAPWGPGDNQGDQVAESPAGPGRKTLHMREQLPESPGGVRRKTVHMRDQLPESPGGKGRKTVYTGEELSDSPAGAGRKTACTAEQLPESPGAAGRKTVSTGEQLPEGAVGRRAAIINFDLKSHGNRATIKEDALRRREKTAALNREKEAKAKKMRQELLTRRICDDPLSKELSERSFVTTWVSPPMMRLSNADKSMLRKRSAESFQVKMLVRPVNMRPLVIADSCRRSQQAESQAGGDSNRAGGPKADPSSASKPLTTSTSLPNLSSNPQAAQRRPVGGAPSKTSTLLEPPAQLNAKLIRQRLEDQQKTFSQKSFARYMKEHDVFTGIRKSTLDEKRLRDEEDAYVKKMRLLVGGKPKRLLDVEAMSYR